MTIQSVASRKRRTHRASRHDTLITQNGRGLVRHSLQAVGSTFGTGALGPHDWDEGYEYLYEVIQPWQVASYERNREVGRFEAEAFDPEKWRSRVTAAAVLRARDDDTFWAALRVTAFSDELIRAAASTAEYTDPQSERLLADVLITRRERIARTYLTKINPLVRFALSEAGTLTFENAAVRAGVALPAEGYRAVWHTLDNATGAVASLGEVTVGLEERLQAPPELARATASYIRVDVSSAGAPHPSWSRPIHAYFRQTASRWMLVGFKRIPCST